MGRLDLYEDHPSSMREYLSSYGWNFSQKLAEYAVSKMKNKSNKHYDAKKVMELLLNYGIKVDNEDMYNVHYLFNNLFSDHFPKTLKNEQDVASAINDILNDEDGYEGMALTRYYADCIGKGEPLYWEKYL